MTRKREKKPLGEGDEAKSGNVCPPSAPPAAAETTPTEPVAPSPGHWKSILLLTVHHGPPPKLFIFHL